MFSPQSWLCLGYAVGPPGERDNPNEISKRRYLMGRENIENKANVNIGKIDVKCYLISE